jgi:phosphatidylglycerol---prolipoprotein diacylglyceryl transferase
MIALIAGIILGGRLGHVIIYNLNYYSHHLIEIIQIRKGGMSFIGGMIGVAVSLILVARTHKIPQQEMNIVLDLVLLIVPVGIFLGRIGNFLNQELY